MIMRGTGEHHAPPPPNNRFERTGFAARSTGLLGRLEHGYRLSRRRSYPA
jgi:hypothetical protein